jgi:probable HAF family extracellular repeat protein
MRGLVALGLATLSCGAIAGAPPRFDVCELAPVPGVFFAYDAIALNDRGDVVGQGYGPTSQPAFVWDRFRGARELEILPGHWLGRGQAINNWRLIAGVSAPLPGRSSAVVWVPRSGIQRVTAEGDDYQPGTATGVNELGQLVGGDGSVSFVWDFWRGLRQLDPVPGLEFSVAQDINNFGLVLVTGFGSGGAGSALISPRTSRQERVPLESAYGLNDRGQVIGITSTPNGSHAGIWDRASGVRDLGDMAGGDNFSQAKAINNAGTVVGLSSAEGGYRAFVWAASYGLRDLNALIDSNSVPAGMVIYDAVGINNHGWILAHAVLEQVGHTYLLRPRRERATGIEEPGCL